MDELEFKRLIERYQQGLLSGREKQLMDEWFNSIGQDIHQLWSEEDKLKLKKKILAETRLMGEPVQMTTATGNISPLQGGPRGVYRIAASILILIAAGYGLWKLDVLNFSESFFRNPVAEVTSVTAAPGKIQKVLLADGSIVWLKDNSTLIYPSFFSDTTRNVTLRGEALFEVAKDAEHPFMIQCGELTTTVLGTSFNIKATEKDIEVVVLTGKVALTSAIDKQGIVVVKEEKAVYRKELKQLAKVEPAKEEVVATISGTDYDMNFNDTQMNEIIRRIKGKFNVEVAVEDSRLLNCVITADFTDQSLEKTLDIITTALAVEYEIDEDEVTLKGNGCE